MADHEKYGNMYLTENIQKACMSFSSSMSNKEIKVAVLPKENVYSLSIDIDLEFCANTSTAIVLFHADCSRI